MLVIKRPPAESPLWKKKHSIYTCQKDIDKCLRCRREYKKLYSYFRSQKYRDHIKNRKLTDINFKLADSLRCRLRSAIKKNTKTGSAVRDLGCTIEELKVYLEKQFKDGMTWQNHGKWHIDHIIPLISFNLEDREQFLKACHYTNLQPLWAKDNLSKGGKI